MAQNICILQISDLHRDPANPIRNDALLDSLENDRRRYALNSAGAPPPQSKFEPAPPILRPDIATKMKVLTVATPHDKLNRFQMFLTLSDRAIRTEGDFLRWPHTTKLIWGTHRVTYIFTDATGGLSLYYDIELKEPLESKTTGGAMFPTTTIITKDRIYVPVPTELEAAFRITAGAKEFYVRFDTIP